MSATQVPTLICRVARPINCAVATESLLTSVQKIASKPASSAARATSCISVARHPVPGIMPTANRSDMLSSRSGSRRMIGSRLPIKFYR